LHGNKFIVLKLAIVLILF